MAEQSSSTGRKLQRLIFGVMYRLGKTPWDGHELPEALRTAAATAPPGRALDVGCGTGDATIFMARNGWEVTAVDFVQAALDRARAKAEAAGVHPRFVRADVTGLSAAGVGSGYSLIVDQGLLHGLPDGARWAYAREISAAAAPGARMVLGAFRRGERRGPHGIERNEIAAAFGPEWTVSEGNPRDRISSRADDPIIVYELRKRGPAAG